MARQTLANKLLLVLAGAVPAFLTVYAVGQHAGALFASVQLPADDPASRIAYVVHWLLLPALTLLGGILAASGWRAGLANAIDGTRTPENRYLESNLRYNQNTLEQLVLAAIAWMGIALIVTPTQLLIIPAMATLFVFGRVAFWVGYLLHPQARAFGMVLTALPTVAAYGWLVSHLWRAHGA